MRLALWIASGIAALVGLYATLGFWVARRVIRSQVVAQVEQRYHRKASIGEVRFNRTRAEAVQALLLGEDKIDPARVFVTAQPPLEEKTVPVRMTLSLS